MMRLIWAAVLAASCVCGLWTATAPAQSGEESGSGPGVEIRSVSTIAPVRPGERALEVYRALIPDGLTMPREPAVGVWLADLAFVAGRGRPADDASHWLEGAVQIRVLRRGDDGKEIEGWYPIHYPVTAEFWFNAGRYVGLPKRHADAAITPQGPGWSATATPRGTTGGPSFAMDWQPGGGHDPAVLTRAFRLPSDPLLALNAPLKGPDLMRVQYSLGKPGFVVPGGPAAFDPKDPKPDGGTVRLRVRDDLDALQEADLPKIFPKGSSLGDIMEIDQTLPGTHKFATVALGSSSEKIGEGAYGPRAEGPPPSGGGSQPGAQPGAGPGGGPAPSARDRAPCRSRRSIVMRFRAFPKAKVRSVRVSVNGRRVGARVLRGRRVAISLRGVAAGRQRVEVVVRQTQGMRMTTRRTFTTCARKRR